MKNLGLCFLCCALLIASHGACSSVAAASVNTFSDVQSSHWANPAIELASSQGYLTGYPDGTFKPDKRMTRAEFIALLVEAIKLPHSQGGTPWYQPYVAVALELGLLDAADSTSYMKPISRMEIIRMIAGVMVWDSRYKAYYEDFKELSKTDFPFEDRSTFQNKDLPAIAIGYGAEVISGFPGATLGLHKETTRAEAVVMLNNWLNARLKDPHTWHRMQKFKGLLDESMRRE